VQHIFITVIGVKTLAHQIRLAEGGGGEATADLIKKVFWSRFRHPELLKGNDASVLEFSGQRIAVTTDSFVVTPWQFPGGNIGRLAICGTVNDLAMMGAHPLGLTASFIIEEGFALDSLELIVQSMADTAVEAGVQIVAGDTKVVNKGAADGIFINTTGIGTVEPQTRLGGELAQAGDQVIITGSIGDHGAAVMLARGELKISGDLLSDVAPLNRLLLPLIQKFPGQLRVLRDPTRGGLATTLNEIARQSAVSIRLAEKEIPVKPQVKGITGLLGLEALYLANEGKAVLICAPEISKAVVSLLREHPLGKAAGIIGEINSRSPGLVSIYNDSGGERILPMGSGEQLPRIC
jgi:hydrogenase expression/formation protein HypE